jgi:hypothetical protein
VTIRHADLPSFITLLGHYNFFDSGGGGLIRATDKKVGGDYRIMTKRDMLNTSLALLFFYIKRCESMVFASPRGIL